MDHDSWFAGSVCTELPHVCTVCVQMCVQFERVKSEETRGL